MREGAGGRTVRRLAGLGAGALAVVALLPQLASAPVPVLAAGFTPAVQTTDSVPVAGVSPSAPPDTTSAYALKGAPAVAWPAAGSAQVAVGAAGPAKAGALPVTVAAPDGATAVPSRVQVQVLDQAAAASAGLTGVLLRVGRADGATSAGPVRVTVDDSSFANAAGGGFAGRLQVLQVPECALTTPAEPQCQATPLPTDNDLAGHTVSARLDAAPVGSTGAASQGTLFAVAATPTGGGGGDFTATSLRSSSTWEAGDSSGDFSWSYPIRVAPGLGGPTPGVGLSYSSQALDGLTAATNNQPSWIGDGFGYDPGFIERSYKGCADDGQSSSGDLCWGTDNATLVLPGHGGELIQDASDANLWHPKDEDGTRVQRLFDSSLANGARNGEHWKVTTTDGTQYFFGLNHLRGWTSGKPETASVAYAPVFGNNAGEPCNSASGFAASSCQQAYRWSLDYVVDAHGSSMSLWYGRELNSYSRNRTDASVSQYVRASTLSRIDYGTRSGSDLSAQAPARVVFAVADRCVTAGATCTADKPNWPNWPDVPWDQQCASTTSCAGRYAPTFWSQKRLSQITTQVSNGNGTWRNVEQWTLGQQWLDPGDGNAKTMFLRTLSHAGLAGGTATEPDLTFNGVPMNNRVDVDGSHDPIIRFRVSSIANETGGVVSITYSGKDCVKGGKMPASPDRNTFRCFPAWWVPPAATGPVMDWFNRYVVTQVSESDGGMGSDTEVTSYAYPADGAAWHYDESELTPPSRKTWAQWRGYDTVTATHGAAGTTQSQAVIRYFRGMDGDHLPSGTRSATYPVNGTTYRDSNWWAGQAFEAKVLNGVGGAMVSDTLIEPFAFGPTATRTRNGVTVEAMVTDELRTTVHTALDGGRPDRVTQLTNTYDTNAADGPPGRLVMVDDRGDTATAADDRCTRTTYARNDSAYLYSLPVEQETVGVGCATAPDRSKDVLSDVRTWYDGATAFGTSVSRGDATRVEELSDWNGGSPIYVPAARSTYDAYGRVLGTTDPLGRLTSTAYTPATGGPLTGVAVTNPLGWVTTSTIDPAWGEATSVLDPAGHRTDLQYDPFGRATAVWQPGRDRATQSASETASYTMRGSAGGAVVTRGTLNPAGTGYVTSYTLYDGMLRPRQTQGPAADGSGGRVIADTIYDSRGLVAKTNAPYFNSSAPSGTLVIPSGDNVVPGQTLSLHDGAERDTAQVFRALGVERWRTTTAYGGDRVDVTPVAGGTATSTWADARGHTAQLGQYQAATPTGAFDATTYGYDRAGRQTSMTDPAGNRWTWTYDQRGRRISSVDPDSGSSTNTFDDDGELTSSTDSRGVTLAMTYDSLGRRTAEFQGSPSGTKLAQWTYDTLAKGELTSSTRFVNGSAYVIASTGFDPSGRSTGASVTIPAGEVGLAGTYTFGSTYNAAGAPARASLPAAGGLPAETLTYGYSAIGMPTTLGGLTSYVTQTMYDAFGQPAMIDATSGGGKHLQQYWYRDSATRRLSEHLVFGATTPNVPSDVHYSYDAAGNLTSMADQLTHFGAGYGPDDTQCFTYDSQDRLTGAWTPASGDCTAKPATGGLGGAAPYWQTYTYDKAGNRLTKVQHAAAGDTTTAYTYPAAGKAQPHAVTSATTTGPGVNRTDAYGYDPAGDTTSRPGPSAGQTLTWDLEGHLATVTESGRTSSYVYAPDGSRLIGRDSGGATLYLPGMEVHVGPGGTSPSATRYYTHAGQSIGVRTSQGLTWTADDAQGTAQVAVSDATFAVTKRYQDPFGMARGPATTWPDPHAFMDGVGDSTGLTHMGAREYDAGIGRFISVDPILDTTAPQTVNPFTYAESNPTTYTDADGLRTCDFDCVVGSFLQRIVPKIVQKIVSIVHRVVQGIGRAMARVNSGIRQAVKKVKHAITAVRHMIGSVVNRINNGIRRTIAKVRSVVAHSVVRAVHAAHMACFGLTGNARCNPSGVAKKAGIGQPWSCDAFPDVAQCREQVTNAYRHLNAQLGYCAGVCASVSFQGGVFQFSTGAGVGGLGGSLMWDSTTPDKQGALSASVCGADIVGPCYAYGPTVDADGNWTGTHHMAGAAFGAGEIRAGASYQFAQYDVEHNKFTGPQEPLPPAVNNRLCRIAWWC